MSFPVSLCNSSLAKYLWLFHSNYTLKNNFVLEEYLMALSDYRNGFWIDGRRYYGEISFTLKKDIKKKLYTFNGPSREK